MSKKDALRILDYLEHILEAIDRIYRYVEDLSEVGFLEDEKTQDAVVRNFEIIGEAAHNIELHHTAYAEAHADVPWSLMYTMRNRVAHGYFKVDYELVWQTIQNDLSDLHYLIQPLINEDFNI